VEASGTSTARSRPENAFDFIRIVAAFGVLFSHSFALLGHHEPTFYGGQSLGGLSVFVFFAVSGYLVMTSWDRAESARVFAVNRGLRIFPGLIVCLLLCAFVLGPAATVSPLSSYFGSAQPYLFVATNVVMFTDHVVISLPGMFRDLPIANAINGSLWTIPYEIFMYATLLAAVCATRRRTLIITSLLVAYVMIWAIGTYNRPSDPGALLWRLGAINLTGKHLLNLAPFFLVGALIARAPRRFLNSKIAVIFAAASLVFNDWKFAIAVLWLALPYCVLVFAFNAPKVLNRFGKHGDFSYGTYLYAFPVQQTLAYYKVGGWFTQLVLASAITLLLAALSWRFIESPALKLKARSPKRASETGFTDSPVSALK
jgi:peptidoglycan/LPS O-acetylase OafA/YrhL